MRVDLIIRENILVVGEADVSPEKQKPRNNSLHLMENSEMLHF